MNQGFPHRSAGARHVSLAAWRAAAAVVRRAAVVPETLERRVLFAGEGPIVINEFLADNGNGLADVDGQRNDWIELRNPTAAPVNLAGYVLRDSGASWTFPNVTIQTNGFLLVWASDKNRTNPAAQLHTNFKLSKEGEYLGLIRPDAITVSDEYAPQYPEQAENVSYGVLNGVERYFTSPTPGAQNTAGATGLVADTQFDVDRGFFDAPFPLRIATTTPGATIRYTTNGIKPTATTGTVYTGPITISKTTVVRAAAFKTGLVPSNVDTQTYLFLDDVVRQTFDSTVAAGFPSSWGQTPADYGMDSDVIGFTGPDLYGGVYNATIKQDLKSIPTMSIVMPTTDLFGLSGIYTNSQSEGPTWERGTSIELLDPSGGGNEFQTDAGIQINGAYFRQHSVTKKHSFRVVFKDQWGPPKLDFPLFGPDATDYFDTFILRADANDSWAGGGAALYSRDMWARQAQRAMGYPSSDGERVHLYINGIYWGLYNTTERTDNTFAEGYIGGDKADWDVVSQFGGVIEGNRNAWNTMVSLAANVQSAATEEARTSAYQRIQGNNPDGTDNPSFQDYLDVDNYIDYMVLNLFMGNLDWPHNNWRAVRLRTDNGIGTDLTGFKFFAWDSEASLNAWEGPNTDRTGVTEDAAIPYARLRSSAEFRTRFADRVQRQLFNNGALTIANSQARMNQIVSTLDRAIVGESARWGDQHNPSNYTRADVMNQASYVGGLYMEQRHPNVVAQLRAAGLYPTVDAPHLGQAHGGPVPVGHLLGLTGGAGTIYYTLDGSDPRLSGGALNPAAQATESGGAMLVPTGSVWRYLDNGSNQGTAWREPAFDDSSWASGPAQLGYSNGEENDEATIVGFGPDPGNKYITTYFRRSFTVDDPARLTSLRIRLLRDDGAVVYINGQRVAWSNFDVDQPYNHLTPASTFVDGLNERAFVEFAVGSDALVAGENVIAVEVHQISRSSSDISFDLELTATAPATLVPLPGGDTLVRARVRDAGGTWSALTEAVFHTDAAATAENLAITEVNYHPHAPEPGLGETASANADDYEFVELANTGPARVTLQGVRFVHGITATIPMDTYLDAGERAVLVRNLTAFRQRYGNGPRVLGTYAGSLDNAGELVIFQDAKYNVIDSFHFGDSGAWPDRADGRGASLEAIDTGADYNDPDTWRGSSEYGGTPCSAGAGPASSVVVNEVLTSTTPPALDVIELHNPTGGDVNVGGWYLSDSAANFRKFRIPDGTSIPAGEYLLFDESQLGFALDGDGDDDVWLFQADSATTRLTRLIDRLDIDPAAGGESLGRWVNGSAANDPYPMAWNTLGTANAGVRVGPVVINEIMHSPAPGGQEFVELRNITQDPVALDGWELTGGLDLAFGAGTTIPAGGYLLLVGGDAAAFRAANPDLPADVPVLGPFTVGGFLNVLDNAGEQLRLMRPGATGGVMTEVERVRYGTAAPWPTGADGTGASIARVTSSAWGDTPTNWNTEAPGGSPGEANFGGATAATVVARHAFYNGSALDGNDPGAGASDDAAIAADKAALIAGAPDAANHTATAKGINGIMIDVQGLPPGAEQALDAADFTFRTGTGGDPATWTMAVAPTTIAIRRGDGAGGTSDRVTLIWDDAASVKDAWLQVTVNANADTGLAASDVFYFGNLRGDATGDGAVSVADVGVVSTNFGLADRAVAQGDFTGDGQVTVGDVGVLSTNFGKLLDAPLLAGVMGVGSSPGTAAAVIAAAPPPVFAAPPFAAAHAARARLRSAVLDGGDVDRDNRASRSRNVSATGASAGSGGAIGIQRNARVKRQ